MSDVGSLAGPGPEMLTDSPLARASEIVESTASSTPAALAFESSIFAVTRSTRPDFVMCNLLRF